MTPLRLEQEAAYQGDDYWKWSVWLAGRQPDIDRVKYVEYTLHPTFPDPVRRIRDRDSQFRLSTAGWGEFTIYAKVVFKDGNQQFLEHELKLSHPAEEPARG